MDNIFNIMHLEKQMNHAYVVPYIFFQKVINSKDKINSTIQRFKINIFTSRFQVFCSDFKRNSGTLLQDCFSTSFLWLRFKNHKHIFYTIFITYIYMYYRDFTKYTIT